MKTIINLFENSVKKYSKNIFLWEKKTDKYKGTTYKNVQKLVCEFAGSLMDMGFKKGDRIALISEGRNDWLISELGILYAGGICVPISVKINEDLELKFRLEHSNCKIIIVSGNHIEKIRRIKNELSYLEKIIVLDKIKLFRDEICFLELIEKGKKFLMENEEKFKKVVSGIKEDDIVNISYTSGTTSDPKGVVLTHKNYVTNVEQANSLMEIPSYFRTLIILPWDHSFAHTAGLYTFMSNGASIASVQVGKSYIQTLKNIPINIKEIKPHLLLSVPALAKNFKKNIENGIRKKGAEKLFKKALKFAYSYNQNGFEKDSFRFLKKPLYNLYDKLIFSKIRKNFGGNLKYFIGGGAILDIELQKFFYALKIPMFQGYGLSEASPIISSNSKNKHKLGTSGFLVKNLEVKICDENGKILNKTEKGEIVVKGDNVMKSYWENPKATSETIKNGWLYTGDLGYFDKDDFIYVVGRSKSLLISSDGEKFSPEGIEEALVEHSKYIDQCILHNNQNPYTIVLIVPNKTALQNFLKEKKLYVEQKDGQDALMELLQKEINKYKKGGKYENEFPERWLPSCVAILSEAFTEENKFLNSTMKIVRNKVVKHYKKRIDFLLFTKSGKNICNNKNRDEIIKIFSV